MLQPSGKVSTGHPKVLGLGFSFYLQMASMVQIKMLGRQGRADKLLSTRKHGEELHQEKNPSPEKAKYIARHGSPLHPGEEQPLLESS